MFTLNTNGVNYVPLRTREQALVTLGVVRNWSMPSSFLPIRQQPKRLWQEVAANSISASIG